MDYKREAVKNDVVWDKRNDWMCGTCSPKLGRRKDKLEKRKRGCTNTEETRVCTCRQSALNPFIQSEPHPGVVSLDSTELILDNSTWWLLSLGLQGNG